MDTNCAELERVWSLFIKLLDSKIEGIVEDCINIIQAFESYSSTVSTRC